VRLAMAFSTVILISVAITALLANYQVTRQFRGLMMHNQLLTSPLNGELVAYYAAHGSWTGVAEIIDNSKSGGMGMMGGQGMRYGQMNMTVADAQGRVVYGSGLTTQLSEAALANAITLESEAKIIGYFLNDSVMPASPQEQRFLNQTNWALAQGGLVAVSLGVLLSLGLAWGLAQPLKGLVTAAQRIAQGEFNQRVTVTGTAEMADLAHAFNEMTAYLQQAETLRQNLVADVAHELRTPLSVIQGNLQAILDDVYPLDKTEIAMIYEETITLNRLITDLRDLAQSEAGQLSLNVEPLDLRPLLQNNLDLFHELAQEKAIQLHLISPSSLPQIMADPDRLRQILHNLLSNALRHTPHNGQITVQVEPLPQAVKISVWDTGAGIAANDLPHVFDRFWRADRSRAREQGGSGLGLAITRQLVKAHGGEIGVSSELGRGSCFWFTLPGC
jgi:two-component system OmpR family sensor kinase/two-component system sensor histidine kinase BaeS